MTSKTDWNTISVDHLQMTVRTANVLFEYEIKTVGEVDNMTDAELLRCVNLGRGSLADLRQAMDEARHLYHKYGKALRPVFRELTDAT